MLAFYHKKEIDMLKLGCTLPNLANICLHKSTSAKFYPFTETDKDLLQKIREDMVGGPSNVFTRKAVVDETFIRNSGNICKSIVGIDASQLVPYSTCQAMPTGLYTRWEHDAESNRFKPHEFYSADSLGCKGYSFLNNQHYKQMMPAPLQSHPSVWILGEIQYMQLLYNICSFSSLQVSAGRNYRGSRC